jgi:hypothetical protein
MNHPSQVASALLTALLVLLIALILPTVRSASDTVLIATVYYDTHLANDP